MNTPTTEQRLEQLLAELAEITRPCRYCEAPLYFLRNREGHLMAYTAQGINHLADCPYTTRRRRGVAGQQTLLDTRPLPD